MSRVRVTAVETRIQPGAGAGELGQAGVGEAGAEAGRRTERACDSRPYQGSGRVPRGAYLVVNRRQEVRERWVKQDVFRLLCFRCHEQIMVHKIKSC